MTDWLSLFPTGLKLEPSVSIHGHELEELLADFGSPLIVYDMDQVRSHVAEWSSAFGVEGVHYASKAFLTVEFARQMAALGIGLDVAGVGECHTALAAGFPPERIVVHGNNKSDDELAYYVEHGVGLVVVDNPDELQRLGDHARRAGKVMSILLRVSPGVEAHTHEYLQTGIEDTKFGIPMGDRSLDAAALAGATEGLRLRGLHAHIGSQIFDPEPFAEAARRMVAQYAACADASGHPLDILDLGGGWGIRYVDSDDPAPISELAKLVADSVAASAQEHGIPAPTVFVEPGRSIVGPCAMTLYTAGAPKKTTNKTWVPVDGGMTDNIRPALYGATYTVKNLSRPFADDDATVQVAGKLCESGDLIATDCAIALPESGEILGVAATGAYCYAMASNYNRVPRPAVIGVSGDGVVTLARRETLDDLLRLDG